MPMTIICVKGPGNTGKTKTIRAFTDRYLKYSRTDGEVRGIFPMPKRRYAVGVNSSGDNPRAVSKGQRFLEPYNGLRVMIIAARTRGATPAAVETIAARSRARLHWVETKRLPPAKQKAAIEANIREIESYMPRRLAGASPRAAA